MSTAVADGQRRRRWPRVVIVGVGLLALLVALLHAPPLRRLALRTAIATLQDRYGVILTADDLSYNLLTLRVTLSGVELAAIDTPRTPFLTADSIEATFPDSLYTGQFSIERVRLEHAHIVIARDASGRTNLPTSRGETTGAPAAIPIQRIEIPNLAVDISDAPLALAASVPDVSVDVGSTRGTLRLLMPGRFSRSSVTTQVTALGGATVFDGRTIHFTDFMLASSEAAVTASGTLALFVAEPSIDLRVSARADLGSLARWSAADTMAAGTVTFDGAVRGRLTAPTASGEARSQRITWDTFTASDLRGDLVADPDTLRISGFDASVAGGRVRASGDVAFATTATDLMVSWTDVNADALVAMLAPGTTPRPAGRATGTASMSGAGSDLTRWTIDARTDIRALPARTGQLAVGGAVTLRTSDGRWRLDASPTVMNVPITANLRGALSSARFADSTLGGVLSVRDVDAPGLVGALGTAGLLDVTTVPVTTGTLDADVTLEGTLGTPRAEISAAIRGLTAKGTSDLSAELMASGTMQLLTLDAMLHQGTGNTVHATGTLRPDARRLDTHLEGRLTDLSAFLPDQPVGGVVEAQFDARGPFNALAGTGTVTVTDARYGDLRLGRLAATIGLDSARLNVNAVSDELGATATAQVSLDAAHEATVDVTLDETDLGRFASQIDTRVPFTGRVTLTAHASGPLSAWRQGNADVSLTRLDSTLGDLPVRINAPAHILYRGNVLEVTDLEALLGATTLTIAGRLPMSPEAPTVSDTDALRAVLNGDLTQALDAIRATGLVRLPDLSGSGPLTLLARVTGSVARPALAADVELSTGTVTNPGFSPVDAIELRAHLEDGVLELRTATADWEGSHVMAEGRAPLRLLNQYLPSAVIDALPPTTGGASLTASATSMTARMLAPFFDQSTIDQIDGTVDASAVLNASTLDLGSLTGEVRLDRFDVRVATLAVGQREPTRVTFEDGFARIASWNWVGEGATIHLQGQVRLADRQAAILADGRVDLRTLNPFVRDADVTLTGSLTPRISVTGPLGDPRIDGDLTLSSGNLRLGDPRVIATGLNARAILSRTHMQVTNLTGVVNGGTLTGTGDVDYRIGAPLSARFTANVEGAALEFPEGLRSELDAGITMTLADSADGLGGRLEGTVTVAHGEYRDQIAVVTGLLASLRAKPLTSFTRPGGSVLDRLALDVRIVTDTDLVVDNNVAQVALDGDLRVVGTAATPGLSGRSTIREGGQLYLGRNTYTITSGTIDFTNPVLIEPNVNIVATTRAGGESITLTLTGTPDDPDVVLRSETSPELGQADLASLLLTGKKLDEVPGSETQIVGEQVLGYLSGDFLGAASRVVGLDTIRLGGLEQSDLRRDPAAVASVADPTSRLTFGKNLSDAIELTFSQSLRAGDGQTWILDYRPISRVDLRLVSRDDNLRSYEFRHDLQFGTGTTKRSGPRVERPAPPLVVGLTFSGTLGASESTLRSLLRLTPGDRFDFSVWQNDRDRLESFLRDAGYRESRVTAERDNIANEVSLTYGIETGPRTAIAVNGYSLPGRVMDELNQAWSESILDDFLKEETDTIVRRALADNGYLKPEITVAVTTTDVKTLRIDIAPGDRAEDRRIAVNAGDAALAADLEAWIHDQGLDEVAWQDPSTVADALEARLGSLGYLNATATAEAPRVDGRTATRVFAVDEGAAFTLGAVRFTGAGDVDAARLRASAALDPGGPYDPTAVEAARTRVMRMLRDDGYAGAGVTLAPAADETTHQVSMAFTIDLGPRQVLRDVSVEGNRSIDTDVITRALDVTVGEPIGANSWLPARARLFDTALFQRADVKLEPMPGAPASPGERAMRMVVTVQEWPALRVRYGIGLSEEHSQTDINARDLVPGLSADVTRRTLFGRAITIGGAAEYQRLQRLGRVFLTTPTLFGLPVESLMTVEKRREDLAGDTLLSSRSSVTWEQRVRVKEKLRLSYSFKFERNHVFEKNPIPDPLFPAFDTTVNTGRVAVGALYDTRDNPIDTRRGMLLSSNVEYAPESLGSGISFLRHLGQAYYFKPVKGMVSASAARVGTIVPLGGEGLIASELFFGGGARSVRGVEQDGLGPRNAFNEPAGGGALVILNQELRFPIFRWTSGVGFLDAGNVFNTPSAIDFGNLVGAFGLGLRVTTPFAMLRVDYARLWSPREGQTGGRWTFGIGQAF